MRIKELLDTEEKKNWNKSGRLRKTSFLYYLINKRKIYYEGDKINLCNQLDSMITVLNEVYKDNWDFYLYSDTLQLIIHFPKIEISNTKGAKHTIKNLLVRFGIQLEDNVKLRDYSGARLKTSLTEQQKCYFHSHLPGNNELGHFRNFCYAETEVNDLQMMFNSKFDIKIFDLLLQTIDAYVRHESLEGVPYKHLSSLIYNKEASHNLLEPLNEEDFYEVWESVFSGISLSNIEYQRDNNNFLKVDREKVNTLLKTIVLNYFDSIPTEYLNRLFCLKKIQKTYNDDSLYNISYNNIRDNVNKIKETSLQQNAFRFPTNNTKDSTVKFLLRGQEIELGNYTTIEHKNYAKKSKQEKGFYEKGEIREQFIKYATNIIEKTINKQRKTANSSF